MAKRKNRRKPRRAIPASDAKMEASPRVWQTPAISKAGCTSTKRGVARAQAKHKDDLLSTPEPPTLADRFNLLPTELRAHIFSLLIVQPVKWDMSHRPSCPKRISITDDITPDPPYVSPWGSQVLSCASCEGGPDVSRWRRDVTRGLDIWTSPWRSRWIPAPTNPYLCSRCYDNRFRKQPFPKMNSLPCLCTRRQNLDVLLVCKQWYSEAATVFYTRNFFAFEDPKTFIRFMNHLSPRWHDKIAKISLMALNPASTGDVYVDSLSNRGFQLFPRDWTPIWSLLRGLPALHTLELDSRLLKHVRTVKGLLQLGLRDLRRIFFVERPLPTKAQCKVWNDGTDKIWPTMACRPLIVGGFAHEVGRAIKGERRMLLKGRRGDQTIKKAVEICCAPDQGIFESAPFEELGFIKTEKHWWYVRDDDGYDEADHLGWLDLHSA